MKLVDRYVAKMVGMYVLAAVFAFTVLIITNNFYASSDLLFHKKIPFKLVAMINLLDTPATMVLSLPVASLFGVMLAIGQLGRSSELTAMRCGGIPLHRVMMPILILSIFLSVATYYLSEEVVPEASARAHSLKSQIEGDQPENIKQNIFFRTNEGLIIYTGVYDTDALTLVRVQLFEREPGQNGWYRITNAFSGRFDGDELIVSNGWTAVYDSNGEMQGLEAVEVMRRHFPRELQEVHEERRDASTLAGGEIAEQISRLQEAGMDSIAEKTDLHFKYSTPVACFIFTFVGFIFSIYSPRKETFVGMLYAIILVLVYYILISVFKMLGKQGIIPWPVVSAWATNIVFVAFGLYIYTRVRR